MPKRKKRLHTKAEQRREANRLAAARSRKRVKQQIAALQQENAALKLRIQELERELALQDFPFLDIINPSY